MTRVVIPSNLSTPASRARLMVRPKPHWTALDPGLHLGYRRGAVGGKWCVRLYHGDHYQITTFSIADDHVSADGERVMSYAQARRKALDLAGQKPVGLTLVSDAMSSYFEHMTRIGRSPGPDIRRCELHILPGLGHCPVDALTTKQLTAWLSTIVRGKTDEEIRSSRASANRVFVMLKAALNMAVRDKAAAPSTEWKNCPPFAILNKPRLRFFSREEVTRLLNATGATDFGNLCRAALFSGIRYGDLCRLVVADYDKDTATIWVVQSKTGAARRIVLTVEGQRFFETLTAGRAGGALMLSNAGRAWGGTDQSDRCGRRCKLPA